MNREYFISSIDDLETRIKVFKEMMKTENLTILSNRLLKHYSGIISLYSEVLSHNDMPKNINLIADFLERSVNIGWSFGMHEENREEKDPVRILTYQFIILTTAILLKQKNGLELCELLEKKYEIPRKHDLGKEGYNNYTVFYSPLSFGCKIPFYQLIEESIREVNQINSFDMINADMILYLRSISLNQFRPEYYPLYFLNSLGFDEPIELFNPDNGINIDMPRILNIKSESDLAKTISLAKDRIPIRKSNGVLINYNLITFSNKLLNH